MPSKFAVESFSRDAINDENAINGEILNPIYIDGFMRARWLESNRMLDRRESVSPRIERQKGRQLTPTAKPDLAKARSHLIRGQIDGVIAESGSVFLREMAGGSGRSTHHFGK